eukprot:m.80504 g.80504  ORF g.80504 m.80504 type:complete len:155 (+) comp16295_c0_seq1:150-614(+)
MKLPLFAAILGLACVYTHSAVLPRGPEHLHRHQIHTNNSLGATYGGNFSLSYSPSCNASKLVDVKVSGDCSETYAAFQGDYAAIAIFPNSGVCGSATSCAAFCGATTTNACKANLALALSGNYSKVSAFCAVGGLAECQLLPESPGLFFQITSM